MASRCIDGFFWYTAWDKKFHAAALDTGRWEYARDRQNQVRRTKWVREWYGRTIRELRDEARQDRVVLPRNTRELCLKSTHVHAPVSKVPL